MSFKAWHNYVFHNETTRSVKNGGNTYDQRNSPFETKYFMGRSQNINI